MVVFVVVLEKTHPWTQNMGWLKADIFPISYAIFPWVKIYLLSLKHKKMQKLLWYADYYFDVGLSDVSGAEL